LQGFRREQRLATTREGQDVRHPSLREMHVVGFPLPTIAVSMPLSLLVAIVTTGSMVWQSVVH
jgi:hypothetical protein